MNWFPENGGSREEAVTSPRGRFKSAAVPAASRAAKEETDGSDDALS
jgi:hypothetical protein